MKLWNHHPVIELIPLKLQKIIPAAASKRASQRSRSLSANWMPCHTGDYQRLDTVHLLRIRIFRCPVKFVSSPSYHLIFLVSISSCWLALVNIWKWKVTVTITCLKKNSLFLNTSPHKWSSTGPWALHPNSWTGRKNKVVNASEWPTSLQAWKTKLKRMDDNCQWPFQESKLEDWMGYAPLLYGFYTV
jgi:hypothetical protein